MVSGAILIPWLVDLGLLLIAVVVVIVVHDVLEDHHEVNPRAPYKPLSTALRREHAPFSLPVVSEPISARAAVLGRPTRSPFRAPVACYHPITTERPALIELATPEFRGLAHSADQWAREDGLLHGYLTRTPPRTTEAG